MLSLVRPRFGLEECDFVTMISTLHKKYKVILEVQRETVSDSFCDILEVQEREAENYKRKEG